MLILLVTFGLVIFLEHNLKVIFLVGSLGSGTASLIDRIQLLFILLKNFWQLGINGIWGTEPRSEKLYFQ